jgi:hypothetical protein
MTDRELLELAAKAAGYNYRPGNSAIVVEGIPAVWNPLTDDGDALRLAAKLHLCLLWPERNGQAYKVGAGQAGSARFPSFEELQPGVDEAAATRRAIVYAAASIGELEG